MHYIYVEEGSTEEVTPMMQQYTEIKGRNPDSILFFRLGDFYEMFGEDAKVASKELDLTLTTRDRSADTGPNGRIPMCGVPYHSAEAYIARLISKGYKVAICEQLQDPAEVKGLVERDVVRMVTPGTLMESSMLDEGCPNYICSVYADDDSAAVCFAEFSTGEISVTEFSGRNIQQIKNELTTYAPGEAILAGDEEVKEILTGFLQTHFGCLINISSVVCKEDISAAGQAERILIDYIKETQKSDISHFRTVFNNNQAGYMELDINTIRNLELVGSLQKAEIKGSLLGVLDKTKTPMGRRLIRSWVLHPLRSPAAISRRCNAVSELVSNPVTRGELIAVLKNINDIERLIGRISFGNTNCKDLKALSGSLRALPELTALLKDCKTAALLECAAIDTLDEIRDKIDGKITDNPPFSVREGGFVLSGVDAEVDRLRDLLDNRLEARAAIERREQERTGIKKLKISYNKVFGYYIEIPRSSSDDVPEDYIRKQTLVNCERFITEELKQLESELLSAEDNLNTLEYKIFEELRLEVAAETMRIQATAKKIAELDVFCSFAEVAATRNYCMPETDMSGIIDIKDGRHPVVEAMQSDVLFVPNDTLMDCGDNRVAIITGPNMAGKSTYMRQNALIVLMAQIGSFVPARSAHIGITDRIFTRIGASDDISSGKSTFMVEMTEVADILSFATASSLLILDEIGRGTSTYDGMSVARAVLEYCADKRKLGAKTMFATHYHELAQLEDEIDGVKNYNISAKKRGDDIIFLRRIVRGSTDDSYGIEVAKLAGVPECVIKRAKDVLAELEENAGLDAGAQRLRRTNEAEQSGQLSLLDLAGNEITDILGNTDLNTLTPLEALSLLFEMKKKL